MLFRSQKIKQHKSVGVLIVCHFLSSLSWRDKWRVSWFNDFIDRFSLETKPRPQKLADFIDGLTSAWPSHHVGLRKHVGAVPTPPTLTFDLWWLTGHSSSLKHSQQSRVVYAVLYSSYESVRDRQMNPRTDGQTDGRARPVIWHIKSAAINVDLSTESSRK